jgi:hypothetical protein
MLPSSQVLNKCIAGISWYTRRRNEFNGDISAFTGADGKEPGTTVLLKRCFHEEV